MYKYEYNLQIFVSISNHIISYRSCNRDISLQNPLNKELHFTCHNSNLPHYSIIPKKVSLFCQKKYVKFYHNQILCLIIDMLCDVALKSEIILFALIVLNY